jgi:exopolysaccharide biosynthesis WecB/TagA/CpsF family protein
MILTAARQRQPLAVSALAVHGVMTGVLDPEHLYRLNHIDLVVADGQPVRWALNLLYKAGLGHRVYGPTLMDWTLNFAEKQGLSVYFYGSTQPVLNRMCCKLRQKFPNLRIAGSQPSRFGPLTAESADQIAAQIRASGAHMVFVGLGCPRQEVWAFEFRERLGMPIIAVGAAFPFSAGLLKQAPAWMQNSGMEWFFRLCTEPRRLWRRYLLLSPAYLFLVLCQHLGIEFQSVGQQPTQEILHG